MNVPTRVSFLEHLRDSTTDDRWFEFADIYGELIERWLRVWGLQPEDVEDVRQEVMKTVAEEIGRFDHSGNPGAFRRWLRRITANRLARHWDARRRIRREQCGPDLGELAQQLNDETSRLSIEWDRAHNAYVIERLLEKLEGRFGPTSLAAFRRIVLGEESARRVADDLGMTLGAVRVAQHRVLRALKQLGEGMID